MLANGVAGLIEAALKNCKQVPYKFYENAAVGNVKRSTIAKDARRWGEVAAVDQGALGGVAVIFHQVISQLEMGK